MTILTIMREQQSKRRAIPVCRSIAVFTLLSLPGRNAALPQQRVSDRSGDVRLAIPASARVGRAELTLQQIARDRFGVRLQWGRADAPAVVFEQPEPASIEVVDRSGAAVWLSAPYRSVTRTADGALCAGTIASANGTRFEFRDRYRVQAAPAGFVLSRTVRIVESGGGDAGFSSRFALPSLAPLTTADVEPFVPGVWYRDNGHVPASALAGRPDDRDYYFREDRLPFPLAAFRNRRSGATLTLARVEGVPATFAVEDGLNRIIDERLQFGSLGFANTGRLTPTFLFPGTEGERTYVYGPSEQKGRWAYRSHPVREGFTQSYQLLLMPGWSASFPAAIEQIWQSVFSLSRPVKATVDQEKVFKDGMELLSTYCRRYNGVISMPFQARIPTGEVIDASSQMGFVGSALPAASLLIRYGLDRGDEDLLKRSSDLIDHWVTNSMTASGVPRTWYDIRPDGSFAWRPYPTYLRVASEGIDGVLHAWEILLRHGKNRQDWLRYCCRYGDWLTQVQNSDGSFYRAYDAEGRPVDRSTNATDHPVEFLVDLYLATGKPIYRSAAMKAGRYCLRSVHESYAYVAGTPDNPDVADKEGGMMALGAFLALYDVAPDPVWLQAAEQAAWYSDTWVYLQNIPVPAEDGGAVFPKNRSTIGLSLIATGHSGADNFMAAAPFNYYRLFLLTGKQHFRDSARRLLTSTRQIVDWDGTLGYRYPGLMPEALTLAPLRGHGVSGWLPWLTVGMLNPLTHFRDVFGSIDIDSIEKLPLEQRRHRDSEYGKSHGFAAK